MARKLKNVVTGIRKIVFVKERARGTKPSSMENLKGVDNPDKDVRKKDGEKPPA